MSNKNKKVKKNDPVMTARLTEQLENEQETGSPAEKSGQGKKQPEAPVEKPAEKPAEKPVEKPAEKSAEAQTNADTAPAPENEEYDETQELIHTFRSMDPALSESFESEPEEEEETEEAEEPAAEVSTAARPNKFYLVFAIFIIIMSIIGIVSTVSFVSEKISEIADQTALKHDIELFLYPVVTVDPPEFASADKIPESVVIESAIWRILLFGDNTNYERLYNTNMYVPAVDVEFAARTLFGSEAVINHQTVGNIGSAFTYDSERNSYLVPMNPRFTSYSPHITELSNVGELYTVLVEYLPPTAFAADGINLKNTSSKSMEYTLSKTRTSMTIHSIRNASTGGDVHAY